MPRVRLLPHPELCPQGRDIEIKPGKSLCEGLLKAGVAIEHACEMVAACSTCHVYVRKGGDSLAGADDNENDQLDNAWGLEAQSRLSCCIKLGESDITIELPRHTRNHAREH
ncbi:ISC system 2Fe-2S type ferredoxin [Rhodoferax sp. U2-2l]|uniref:ISC system 2Fe-2S type ferredoxin n=1 Tax=Rhodoferax sp. U2-2l TaxID=2884000 RepID=UPI001D09F835|nr:ISC system 2Fe-2S type ferredoxin [Rhodoferax sp. U2-2l]MCB8748045.1 ISC system 2Fe-2S type ferredoxin [Rhodoferax sp. U2-2l]